MRRFIISVLAAIAIVLAVGGAVSPGDGGSWVTKARLERRAADRRSRTCTPTRPSSSATRASLLPRSTPGHVRQGRARGRRRPRQQLELPDRLHRRRTHAAQTTASSSSTSQQRLLHRRRPEPARRQTLPDTQGREVPNPVYEFDGCSDPNGDDTPTGHEFPSPLTVTTTALLTRRPTGGVPLQLSCGTGSTGCRGSVTAAAGTSDARRRTVRHHRGADGPAHLPDTPVPEGAEERHAPSTNTVGVGPASAVTLPMPA